MDEKDPAEARAFAVAAHGDQRYGSLPYVVHLDAVAELLLPFGWVYQTIGYLHDVLEDTEIRADEISRRFGPLVAACVSLLSDSPGANRAERKARTYARLGAVRAGSEEEIALVVKVADRLANVRKCVSAGSQDLLEMYRREHAAFRAAAHRPGLADALWQELDALICAGSERCDRSWLRLQEPARVPTDYIK